MAENIPDMIDAPPQIIIWEADEVAPVVLLGAIGILTNSLTYMFVPMYISYKIFSKYKNKNLPGYLLHMLYRVGLFPLNGKFKNGAETFYHN